MTLQTAAIIATSWYLLGQANMNFQQAKKTSTIHVSITDPFGAELKRYHVELRSMAGVKIAGGEELSEFKDIPFGEYLLIAVGGCCRAERQVTLNVPKLWVKLGVPMRFGDDSEGPPGGWLTIQGILQLPSGVSTTHWVRARGVFLNFDRETQVDALGRFSIGGLDMGTYEIQVFGGSKLLHSRMLEIDPKISVTRIVIEIP